MRDFQTRRQKSLCDESFANRNDFCHALRNEKRKEIASKSRLKKVKLSLANGKNHGEGGGGRAPALSARSSRVGCPSRFKVVYSSSLSLFF